MSDTPNAAAMPLLEATRQDAAQGEVVGIITNPATLSSGEATRLEALTLSSTPGSLSDTTSSRLASVQQHGSAVPSARPMTLAPAASAPSSHAVDVDDVATLPAVTSTEVHARADNDEVHIPRSKGADADAQADGYAHACQAVFAGYIAVAQRQGLQPTIQGFWSTPQRDMILPSLKILARGVPVPAPAATATTTTHAGAGLPTDAQMQMQMQMQMQLQLRDLDAERNFASEKAAVRALLARRDNRYTRPCKPPLPLARASITAVSDDASAEAGPGAGASADAGQQARPSAAEAEDEERAGARAKDLFRPMVPKAKSPAQAQLVASARGAVQTGQGRGYGQGYASTVGVDGAVRTPSWWHM